MEIGSITGSHAKASVKQQKAAEDGSPVASSAIADIKATQVQTANAVQQASAAPSMDQVKQAVQDINKSLQSLSQGLEFSVDTDTKDIIVKVIDQQTKEVLRQMPSKEALAIAKALDQVLGKLIKEQA